MQPVVIRNYLLRFLLIGLAVLGGSRALQCQCCVTVRVLPVICESGACRQEIYRYVCTPGLTYDVAPSTVYCCGVSLSTVYYVDLCLIGGPADPTESASVSSSPRTRTFYILNCSRKYDLVNVVIPET